jgi:diguanylate cyclase (GGDEF)-like protein
MSSSVRAYDTVGRYGGEEFLIVVPATDTPATLTIAERIRKTLESKPVSTQEGELKITASLGVAISSGDERGTADILLRLADEALYRAKARGRNCSELATQPESGDSPSVTAEPAPVKLGSG